MSFEKYVRTKKGQKACDDVSYFCGACVESCKFLIDEYGFEKAEIELVGREYQVEFRKSDLVVGFTYEMGNLPQLSVLKNSEKLSLEKIDTAFSEESFFAQYQAHEQIRTILNSNYSSTRDYTSAITGFWNENKNEIMIEVEKHIHYLGKALRISFSKILPNKSINIIRPG